MQSHYYYGNAHKPEEFTALLVVLSSYFDLASTEPIHFFYGTSLLGFFAFLFCFLTFFEAFGQLASNQ